MGNERAYGSIVNITMNNSPMPLDMLAKIDSVIVEDEINVPTMFTIQFSLKDIETGSWFGTNLDTLKLGDELVISLGTDSAERLVVGEITDIEPFFGGDYKLIVRGFDRMHRLRFGRFRRSFQDVSDADVINQIAVEVGLTANTQDTQIVYPYLYQNNLSNYEFILERINRIGYEIQVNNRELILRPSKENDPVVDTLEEGTTLYHFRARLRALTEGSSVEVRGWKVSDKQEIVGSAQNGDENSLMGAQSSGYQITSQVFGDTNSTIVEENVIDDVNADQLAKGRYNQLLRNFLTGEGETVGNTKIRAGVTIALHRLGDRFSGSYYVVSSKHVYGTLTGYRTTFKVQRSGA